MRKRALLLLLLAGCSPERPANPPAGFFPKKLEAVDPGKFDLASLQVETFITDLGERVVQRAVTDAASAFAPDFEGVPPLAAVSLAARPLAGGLAEVRETKETVASSASTPRQALEAFIREHPRILACRVKMPQMDLWERGAFGTVRLQATATDRAGAGVFLDETFEAVLTLKGGEWKFQRLRRSARREVRCPAPWVREVAAGWGLEGAPEAGPAAKLDPYISLRGAAAGDLDGDGWLDLVLVSPFGVRIFRNDAGRRFVDITKESTVQARSPASAVICWDYDGDGDLDLAISQFVGEGAPLGQPDPRAVVLWRNEGAMRFVDATSESGIASNGPATHLAAADIDLDGDLDLYVCMYGYSGKDRSLSAPHPVLNARNGAPNQLWINQGNGRFVETGVKSGVADTGWALAAAFGDLQGDRLPDLYVANDFGPHRLFVNKGGGTFEEVPADQGFGMGVTWADADNDGDLDVYVSNMYSNAGKRLLRAEEARLRPENLAALRKFAEGNTLLRNDAGKLVDVTAAAGVAGGGWAWGHAFTDLDNDGRLDLYVVNGYISGVSKRDR